METSQQNPRNVFLKLKCVNAEHRLGLDVTELIEA